MAIFCVLGVIGQITFTSYGMAALPLSIMYSMVNPEERHAINQSGLKEDLLDTQKKIEKLRSKYRGNENVRSWNVRDRVELRKLERKVSTISEEGEQGPSETWSNCCVRCFWSLAFPVRLGLGLFLFCFNLLIMVSLGIHLVDQTINSGCNYSCGWSLESRNLINPINIALQKLADYFPLTMYFTLIVLTLFSALCTV
eukprot:UN27200